MKYTVEYFVPRGLADQEIGWDDRSIAALEESTEGQKVIHKTRTIRPITECSELTRIVKLYETKVSITWETDGPDD